MKILLSCLSKSWGGMEMFTLTSALKLKERNTDVYLLCIGNSRLNEEAVKNNINCFPISGGSYFHPIQILKTSSIINQNKINIIHSHASKDLWILVPAIKISNRKNTPLIMTKHVGSAVVKKNLLHNYLYKRLNKALAISSSIKENIIETTVIKPDDIILFHNGVDIKNFNPEKAERNKLRKELNISEDILLIGMIGRMSPGKGHEEFIEAASNLLEKYNNILFVIVGEASFGEEEYETKIKNLGKVKAKEQIVFTGYRSDIPDVLAAFDIFILPSHAEAFGIALIEAMAMGKPVIATKSDGVLDIIVENKNGLFFEKKNIYQLVEKIKYLLESKERRVELGLNARKHVLENFNLDTRFDKLIELYNQININ